MRNSVVLLHLVEILTDCFLEFREFLAVVLFKTLALIRGPSFFTTAASLLLFSVLLPPPPWERQTEGTWLHTCLIYVLFQSKGLPNLEEID